MTDTPRAFVFPFGLIVIAVLFAAFMGAGVLVEPPPVRSGNTPAQFDANAAQTRLARILGDETPHPVDSAAQDPVRERLLAEIRALGYEPEVREQFVCRPQPGGPQIDCAMTRNILFSAGPESGPTILAATHYDSVPAAPGANDAGIGIASWLEIARILRDEPLQRRVLFLISDGEEPGLMGAYAFAQGADMRDVEALVNLEARGTRGPAVFFESNQPNADAVHAFASAPRGIANSVMADVYALLPNSTDVTALTRPGLDIVNVALLEGLEGYHTPQDSLAFFNTSSVQHMGDIGLATTRSFASGPDRGDATPRVYTDVAARAFVSAPAWAAQAALGVSLLIAFAAFWRAGREGRWRALAAPLAALVLAAGIAFAAGFGFSLLRAGETFWWAQPEWTRAWCVLAALIALPLALMILRAPRNAALIGAAAMVWFVALGFASSFFLAGISILYALPAVAYAVLAAIGLAWRPAQFAGFVAAGLVALIVWAPSLFLVELALGFEFPFVSALLVAIVCLTWAGVLVRAQGEVRWRGGAVVLTAGFIVALVGGALAPAATAARPMPLNLNYFVDVSAGEARILAGGAARPLPREIADTADFSAEMILPGDRVPTWAAHAEVEPAPAPTLTELTIAEEGGQRIVRARLAMSGAYRAMVRMPRTAAPISATVNGVVARYADAGEGQGDYVAVACQGRACDGATIEIAFERSSDLGEWFMIGQTPGASAEPADAIRAARPANTTPIQFGNATVTLQRIQVGE